MELKAMQSLYASLTITLVIMTTSNGRPGCHDRVGLKIGPEKKGAQVGNFSNI